VNGVRNGVKNGVSLLMPGSRERPVKRHRRLEDAPVNAFPIVQSRNKEVSKNTHYPTLETEWGIFMSL